MLDTNQKAFVLNIWAECREKKGEKPNVEARIAFNWPSLLLEEKRAVFKAYQARRKLMAEKAVSSPTSPPKHVIRCELGHRLYIEALPSTNAASIFIQTMLGKEKYKWQSPTEIRAKQNGVLRMSCEELEDIIEFKPKPKDVWKLPENLANQIEAFLRGQWDKSIDPQPEGPSSSKKAQKKNTKENAGGNTDTSPKKSNRRPPPQRTDRVGLVTIQEICKRNGWDAKKTRAVMRNAEWKAPDVGWAWTSNEAKKKEAELKKLMK